MPETGKKMWVIAEGYIPEGRLDKSRDMISHETACILNMTSRPAHIEITIYYSDREPGGPYKVQVEARRTKHLRFNELSELEPIAKNTDYASVFISDVPVVIQHTRLDSRSPEISLLSTLAYGV